MTRKVLVLILILVAAGSAIAYWMATSHSSGLVLTGIVDTDEVIVSSQVAGRIQQLLVDEGDTVKQHQLLALLDPREMRADQAYYAHTEQNYLDQVHAAEAALRYQELQRRDQVNQAQAALASARAQQRQAEANYRQAHRDYVRTEALFRSGINSEQSADQARTTQQTTQAQWVAAQKQVQVQRAALALAESNAEQVRMRESDLAAQERQWAAAAAQKVKSQVQLGYTRIAAPIAGVVDVRAALQGEVVNPGQPIITLINPDDLWVSANIAETYIDRIRYGDRLTIRFPDGMERTGTIFFRGVDADFATERDVSRTKRDIKTFEIRLHINNKDRRLRPGLTAYVLIPEKLLQ
jgi:HlyD family secretion protein